MDMLVSSVVKRKKSYGFLKLKIIGVFDVFFLINWISSNEFFYNLAQVEIDAANAPRATGGGLKGEYIFAQFHFHWGKDSSLGSEHTIDGVR